MTHYAPRVLTASPAGPGAGRGGGYYRSRAGVGEAPAQALDLAGLLAILRRGWRTLALTVLAVAGIALLIAYSLTPLYTSTAEVLITPRQKALVGGGLLSPGLSSELMMIESQARIIASESVLRRVVKSEHLDADPEFNGARPASSLRARLKALLGRKETGPSMPAAEAALRMLSKRLSVRRAKKTFVLEISVTSESPEKAARLANAVARAYIADQSAAKSSTARRINTLLTKRLDTLRAQVAEAEAKVEDFKRAHNIVATKKGQLENEARLARLGEELVKARSRAAAAKAKYESIKAMLKAGNPADASFEALNSPVISRLRGDYARISGQAASLAETLGPRHPRLLAAKAQAARIRKLIRNELTRLARSIRAERDAAIAEVEAIRKNLDRVRDKATLTNEARVRLRALEREAQARRKVFENFLLKSKESNEAEKLQIPDARLISPAIAPSFASFPKKKLILGLALLLGLGLGLAITIWRETRRHPPASGMARAPMPAPPPAPAPIPAQAPPAAIAAPPVAMPAPPAPPPAAPAVADGLPVLATLPVLPMARGGADGLFHEIFETLMQPAGMGRAAYAEAVFAILDMLGNRRAVAITAPEPGQGATSLAWALTTAAALRNRKVLLVDANRVNPHLTRALVPASRADVRQALLGWVRPEALISRDPDTGIDVLSLAMPENFRPARDSARAFHDWLAQLRGQYDMMIFDATPVSRAENTFDLVSLLDGILLVAAREASGAPAMREAAGLIAASGISSGVVWNLGAPSGLSAGGAWDHVREAAQ